MGKIVISIFKIVGKCYVIKYFTCQYDAIKTLTIGKVSITTQKNSYISIETEKVKFLTKKGVQFGKKQDDIKYNARKQDVIIYLHLVIHKITWKSENYVAINCEG